MIHVIRLARVDETPRMILQGRDKTTLKLYLNLLTYRFR